MDQQDSFVELMNRLRAGDASAAAEIVHLYSGLLIARAARRLGARLRRKLDPEDVLQSAFGSFFVRQADGRLNPQSWDHLWALLVTLTLRKCGAKVDYFLAKRRNVGKETNAPSSQGELDGWLGLAREPMPAEAAALSELLELLLRDFEGRDLDIVSLRLRGCAPAEIKDQVGCSERTVFRVLNRLKKRLHQLQASASNDSDALPNEAAHEGP